MVAPARVEQTALFEALHNHQVRQVVESLEAHPELAHTCDAEGNSLVMATLFEGYPLLALRIARLKPLDIYEATALGDLNRLHALLSAEPALIGLRNPKGYSLLEIAAYFGQAKVVRHLLEACPQFHDPRAIVLARKQGFLHIGRMIEEAFASQP